METSMLLPLLLLPLSLCLIFFLLKKGSGSPRNLPPGSEGWPFLGENVELSLLGLQQLVRDRMQKYSPDVFKTSLLGEKMAVLCGAKGNKFVFANDNKLFTPWPPTSLRKVLFPDLDAQRRQDPEVTFHNFQYDVLKPEGLKQYVPVMDDLARGHLDSVWRPDSVVRALSSTNKFTFDLACRVFMDVKDPERLGNKLLEPLSVLTKGLLTLPINLPGTPFNRAVRAGKVVRGELLRMVLSKKERRKELLGKEESEGRGDVLSKMVVVTNGDGKYMSDSKVVDVVIGLLVGGYYCWVFRHNI